MGCSYLPMTSEIYIHTGNAISGKDKIFVEAEDTDRNRLGSSVIYGNHRKASESNLQFDAEREEDSNEEDDSRFSLDSAEKPRKRWNAMNLEKKSNIFSQRIHKSESLTRPRRSFSSIADISDDDIDSVIAMLKNKKRRRE